MTGLESVETIVLLTCYEKAMKGFCQAARKVAEGKEIPASHKTCGTRQGAATQLLIATPFRIELNNRGITVPVPRDDDFVEVFGGAF